MLCNLGNASTAGNDTNNNANTNSSMEDDDSYPLPTIYRYVVQTFRGEKERKQKAQENSENSSMHQERYLVDIARRYRTSLH